MIQQTQKAIESGDKSLVQILKEYYKDDYRPGGRLATSRKIGEIPRYMKKLLQNFFKRYDTDRDHKLDLQELSTLMKEILPVDVWNSPCRADKIHELMGYLDMDDCGRVTMKEFIAKAPEFIVRRFDLGDDNENRIDESRLERALHKSELRGVVLNNTTGSPHHTAATGYGSAEIETEEDDEWDDADWEEEEYVSGEDQIAAIKWRAFWMLLQGTVEVIIFSDQMVNVMTEFGKRTGIPLFYLSFVIAPIASNASEVVAAYDQAVKKTQAGITSAIMTLQGAAIMNNTFCLGIFLALVYGHGLIWEYSAESIVMILAQIGVGAIGLKKTMSVLDACLILAIYPATLALCWILENKAGFD